MTRYDAAWSLRMPCEGHFGVGFRMQSSRLVGMVIHCTCNPRVSWCLERRLTYYVLNPVVVVVYILCL